MKLENDIPENVNMDPSKLLEIELIISEKIKEKKLNAMNMAVARHGKLIYHKAIGNLKLAPDSPPAPLDALYSVRSVSKPITATIIMMLHEQSIININDPVQKYLPEFKGEGKDKVTIWHLLTHTTGIHDDDIGKYVDSKIKDFVPTQEPPKYIQRNSKWWMLALESPLTKPTGKEMSYSNTGYNMLGMIIKAVTGKNINIYARETLLNPLGMIDTSYVKSARKIEGRVVERIPDEGQKVSWMCKETAFNRMSGCCSVSTTALDLAVFMQMILNKGEYGGKRYLTPESVKLMTTNQIPGVYAYFGENEYFPEAAWGLGFDATGVKSSFPTNATFVHGGYGGSEVWGDPILDMVVVILKAINPDYDKNNFAGLADIAFYACKDYESLKTPV
ncbi:MAG: beta-lactamase family protein [Clostridiales bacterium]|jgi:CubicO group peptidase (beta-lactamase class C family)|nr:beta-lactamase family protein [Clostridiales bacterium]